MKKQLNQEHIIGIVCLLLAITILLITPSFPSQANINITGPAFFPNVLAIILILCGIYEVILGFYQEKGRLDFHVGPLWERMKTPQFLNGMLIIASILFFIFFFERLGFIICTFLVLILLMGRLGVPLLKNLVYSVCFVVIILLIFGRLFSIPLPSGVLEYIGL